MITYSANSSHGDILGENIEIFAFTIYQNWVSEWLNLTAFLEKADSEVHIVHINCVITAYTLESLSSFT